MVLAGIVVLTPAFVFLATSTVMAECVFSAGALAGGARRRARDPSTTGAAWGGGACRCRVSGGCLDPDRGGGGDRRGHRIPGVAPAMAAAGDLRDHDGAPACCRGSSTLRPTRRPPPTVIAHGGTIAYSYRDLLQMARPGDVRVDRNAWRSRRPGREKRRRHRRRATSAPSLRPPCSGARTKAGRKWSPSDPPGAAAWAGPPGRS